MAYYIRELAEIGSATGSSVVENLEITKIAREQCITLSTGIESFSFDFRISHAHAHGTVQYQCIAGYRSIKGVRQHCACSNFVEIAECNEYRVLDFFK